MSNSNNGEPMVIAMWIITIILTGVAGILSWNWVEPDSFIRFIIFLVLWGILSKVAHLLSMGLVALLSSGK
nr:hypothetical protein [uncultured Draconibacterium sp.]